MSDSTPPDEYLFTCSDAGLESFALSRMALAASLRKEIRQKLEQWIECEAEARLARWMLERRCAPQRNRGQSAEIREPATPAVLGRPSLPASQVDSAPATLGEHQLDAQLPAPDANRPPLTRIKSSRKRGGRRVSLG